MAEKCWQKMLRLIKGKKYVILKKGGKHMCPGKDCAGCNGCGGGGSDDSDSE